MAAILFYLPLPGTQPRKNWRLSFTQTGSATQVDVYTTAALNVAWTQPIIFNTQGMTNGPIFLAPSTEFKVILTDQNGVAVPGYPVNHVSPPAVAAGGASPPPPIPPPVPPPAPGGGGGNPGGTPALRYVLDDFESGLRVSNPEETLRPYKHFWGFYQDTDPHEFGSNPGADSLTSVQTSVTFSGTAALQSHLNQPQATADKTYLAGSPQNANWQFLFRPYLNAGNYVSPQTYAWNWAKVCKTDPSPWVNGRINRMTLRLKLPASIAAEALGSHNFEVGTFIRELTATNTAQESGHPGEDSGATYAGAGWHWYHLYNLDGNGGAWWTIVVDTHPQHQRQATPTLDQGDLLHIDSAQTGNAYTYFDFLTAFYLDFPYLTSLGVVDFYLDAVECWENTDPEDVAHIASMAGSYNPSTNRLVVTWSHPKTDGSTHHEVRYSFTKLATFASGTQPATHDIAPSDAANCTMRWAETTIAMGGHPSIWVAVQVSGRSDFRQIEIPLR